MVKFQGRSNVRMPGVQVNGEMASDPQCMRGGDDGELEIAWEK